MAVLTAALLVLSSLREPTEDTVTLAAEAGVDAMAARGRGEYHPARAARVSRNDRELKQSRRCYGGADSEQVATLVACEASGNWAAVSPSDRYRGGIQADAIFWRRTAGSPTHHDLIWQRPRSRSSSPSAGWPCRVRGPGPCASRTGLRR